MKNTLFTGIIGENPAVLLNREQAPGIGMSLFTKTVARNIIVHLRRPSLLQVYYFK